MARKMIDKYNLLDSIAKAYTNAVTQERLAVEDWAKLEWQSVAAGIAQVEEIVNNMEEEVQQ